MDYKEMMRKRKIIMDNSDNHKILTKKKGNPRSMHVCALCGQPLTKYVSRTDNYIVLRKHYTYTYYNNLHGSLCYDARACYNYRKRKEENNCRD